MRVPEFPPSSPAETWALDFTDITDEREYINAVLPRLSIEEKVLLLAGKDLWRTNSIPRLGVSSIKTSDGPVGVRGGLWTDGVPAAFLPSGVSLAATWDVNIIKDVCSVLVDEARSKEVDVLLGPTGIVQYNILSTKTSHS
jgi:beta-glucosidase-like glycosyl hydrolase